MVETPWWKKPAEDSLRRKAAQSIPAACANPGDSFLIVTEGEVTEPVYLNLLRNALQLSLVTVKLMPGKASDPRHVVQTAGDEAKDLAKRARKGKISHTEPEKYDQVWAVVDTDVAMRHGFWNDVVQKAASMKVKLAHSTPCFEFWLLLHLQMTTRSDLINGDAAKHALKTALGREYSTNEPIARTVLTDLVERYPTAVANARTVRLHHRTAETPQPANPSTHMDLLVTALNDSALPHVRKMNCRDMDTDTQAMK